MDYKCDKCGSELEFSHESNGVSYYRCYKCEYGNGTEVLKASNQEVDERIAIIVLDPDKLEENTYARLVDNEFENRCEKLSDEGKTLTKEELEALKEECREYVEEQYSVTNDDFIKVQSEIKASIIEQFEEEVAQKEEEIEREKEKEEEEEYENSDENDDKK